MEPSPDLTVEPARDEDAGAVLRLHRGVIAESRFFITHPSEFRTSIHDVLRAIRDLRSDPCGLFTVARLDGELAGFLTVRPGPLLRMRHAGKLEVMVAPGSRGRGVGTALLEHALGWATESSSVHKLGLSVFADNARAIKLYRRFGFQEEGHRLQEYRMEDGSWRDDLLLYRFV